MDDTTEPIPKATPPRSGWRRALLALIVLVVLATVGEVIIYVVVPWDEARRLKAALAPAPPRVESTTPIERPIGDGEPAFWSEVAIYKAGPGRPRPIVVIKRGRQPTAREHPEGLYQGLLAREVVRQGLLLAAREELGALTRDVPIGDPEVAGTPDATFRIASRFRLHYQAPPDDPAKGRITIVEGRGPERRVLWARQFDCGMIIAPAFDVLVSQVEEFSRGGFRKVLEGYGLKRATPPPVKPNPSARPTGVAEQLAQPVLTAQYAAIRSLHDAIRNQGETPARLLELARAYANLGTLAESQWTADYLAFQARALLYAQRAVVADRSTPSSLRGQAYAETLVGMFQQALREFERADHADGGKSVPDWVVLSRAFAHTDAAALDEIIAARPDDPWPLYFRFLATLRSSGYVAGHDENCRHEVIAAGRAVLAKVPDCDRVHDGMAQVQGVANLHTATSIGLDLYARAMPKRVAAVPGLPPKVLKGDDRDVEPEEVSLRRRLAAAAVADPADLTWGVLARQLREVRFLQVCRRLHFIAYTLATSAVDFANEALPVLADHPNRAYVEVFKEPFAGPRTLEKLRALDLADIERKADSFLNLWRNLDPPLYKDLLTMSWDHVSQGTVPGQITRLMGSASSGKYAAAHNLLRYDPDSPIGRGALIESNWDEARPLAEGWAKDHGGGDTIVLAQLGFHALKEGKLDEAQRRLETALARSPDGWIFRGLTEVYRTTGQVERWVEAVNDFLKTEDLDLDHSRADGELADYLMARGKDRLARPFVERAAASWSGESILRAARCAEHLEDWDAAEDWIERLSRRYSSSWLDWFFWCARTNHGDLQAAAELVEDQVAAGRPLTEIEVLEVAIVLLLDHKPKQARQILEPRFRDNPHDMSVGFLLVLALGRDGDRAALDATLKTIGADPEPDGPKTARILGIFGPWLADGEKSPLDLEPIDAILAEIEPKKRPQTDAVVGLFLNQHGKTDVALNYLQHADADGCFAWYRLLVRDALRESGHEPSPFPW